MFCLLLFVLLFDFVSIVGLGVPKVGDIWPDGYQVPTINYTYGFFVEIPCRAGTQATVVLY